MCRCIINAVILMSLDNRHTLSLMHLARVSHIFSQLMPV